MTLAPRYLNLLQISSSIRNVDLNKSRVLDHHRSSFLPDEWLLGGGFHILSGSGIDVGSMRMIGTACIASAPASLCP